MGSPTFESEKDPIALNLAKELMKKLNTDNLINHTNTAYNSEVSTGEIDVALETVLLKYAKAMIKTLPNATAENVTVESLTAALSAELSKNEKGEKRGL